MLGLLTALSLHLATEFLFLQMGFKDTQSGWASWDLRCSTYSAAGIITITVVR